MCVAVLGVFNIVGMTAPCLAFGHCAVAQTQQTILRLPHTEPMEINKPTKV
jgi:hypothetical protein